MNENGFNNTRATIKDVAVKANVSLSTVSRALREPDKTPAETVSKVRAAAEALNYVYNATAGSLSKRRSDTIGILLPSPTYAAFGVNLMAIQKTCSERNYSCKVALSQFSPEEERLAMRRFHEQRIGGLILVGLDMSNVEYMKTLEAAGINQTQHKILMQFKVEMSAIIPGYTTSVTVNTQVSIADTLIVGNVPQFYAVGDPLA